MIFVGQGVQEKAAVFHVVHEALELFVTARDDGQRQRDLPLLDLRPDRGNANVIGQRRLEPVEQLRPGKGPAVDEIVGLTSLRRGELDLTGIDRRTQPRGLLAQIRSPRLVAIGLYAELRVAARVAIDARHVEDRRRDDDERKHEQPEMDCALVVKRPSGKIAAKH